MRVPAGVAALVRGPVVAGGREQAFLLLSTDAEGFPHTCLLSRAELDVTANELLAAVASPRTKANLGRDGRGSLVAVGGTVVHTCRLVLRRQVVADGLLGAAFEVVEHRADSLGIPVAPLSFLASAELAELERWQACEQLLARLSGAHSLPARARFLQAPLAGIPDQQPPEGRAWPSPPIGSWGSYPPSIGAASQEREA
jgi:hypothetical protein